MQCIFKGFQAVYKPYILLFYWVFQNLNYRFESGKIYALTGPSGGGKTTLLNCIGRLTDASDGEIMLDNKDVSSIKILKYYRNYIGYLFQNYALVDDETIFFFF